MFLSLKCTQTSHRLTDARKQDDELEEDSKLFLDSSTAADEDVLLKLGDAIGSSPDKVAAPASADDAPLQKKVVLKRKSTSSINSTSAAAKQTATTAPASTGETVKKSRIEPIVMSSDENGASNGTANGKPVTKWSELSEKELQELRAKKFGGPAAHDAQKVARAERFGLAADAAEASAATPQAAEADAPAKVTAVAGAAVEALKKRAERFGGSVSKTMVTIENKAKLLKRQERFATGGSSSGTQVTAPAADEPAADEAVASAPVASAPVSEEQAKRLQARLDRFKTAA